MWKLERAPDYNPVEKTQWIYVRGSQTKTYIVQVSLKNVHVPISIRSRMESIPEFDIVSELVRYKILLEHLRDTGKKVKVLQTLSNYEDFCRDVKSGLWKDVFDL